MSTELNKAQADAVLSSLGLVARPPLDLPGLHAVYSGWCRTIPFDNLRKRVALADERAELPGMDPNDFFAAWQADGAGATCWASNNALHALLHGVGFDAELWSASMFDGPSNHGTTIVTLDEGRFMVDTAIHGDVPAPVIDGETTTVSHAGYQTTVRHDDRGHLAEHVTPDPDFVIPCRLIGPMTYAETVAANEKSRAWSPFNEGVMAAINDATGTWMLKDSNLVRIDETGTSSQTITLDEANEFLITVAGISADLITRVRAL